MSRLPVHPRLARLVVEGEARGVGAAASLAAALIAERDIRQSARASFGGGPGAPSDRGADVLDLVDLFQQAAEARFRPDVLRRLELDRRATEEVDRARRQLIGGAVRARVGARDDQALRLAILAAFPDRVARRREPRARTVVLAAGGSAELGYEAAGEWLVAVDAEERSTPARARSRAAASRCAWDRRSSPSGCSSSPPIASRRSIGARSIRTPNASNARPGFATAR